MKVLIVFVLVFATYELSAKSRGRIFAGENANPFEFRYQVLIFVPSFEDSPQYMQCGGFIIHHEWILTAAHCFDNRNKTGTVVLYGLPSNYTYLYQRNAIDVTIHNQYYRGNDTMTNDIALIKMPFISFDEYSQSVQLSSMVSIDNQVITVAGWGLINDTAIPTKMQYAMLNVLNNTECGRILHKPVPATQFCTRSPLQGACAGDSGGPAVKDSGRIAQQVGLVSYGSTNCGPNITNGYTLISSYLPWIRRKTQLRTI